MTDPLDLADPPTQPTIALIGPDGAGKSTVARRVAASLPFPARYLYMGVNLEASNELLPTTRLILGLKRAGGRRPDLTARTGRERADGRGIVASVRGFARVAAWMAEEWYRAALALRARRRGRVVIFDRHFFCDYYASDIRPTVVGDPAPRRTVAARMHGTVLNRWYPRPDLTILLDAPAEVLAARKGEATIEAVEARRREYLELATVLPAFVIVDSDAPLDAVVDAVRARVVAFVGEWNRRERASSGRPSDGGRPAASDEATGQAVGNVASRPRPVPEAELDESGLAAIR